MHRAAHFARLFSYAVLRRSHLCLSSGRTLFPETYFCGVFPSESPHGSFRLTLAADIHNTYYVPKNIFQQLSVLRKSWETSDSFGASACLFVCLFVRTLHASASGICHQHYLRALVFPPVISVHIKMTVSAIDTPILARNSDDRYRYHLKTHAITLQIKHCAVCAASPTRASKL